MDENYKVRNDHNDQFQESLDPHNKPHDKIPYEEDEYRVIYFKDKVEEVKGHIDGQNAQDDSDDDTAEELLMDFSSTEQEDFEEKIN